MAGHIPHGMLIERVELKSVTSTLSPLKGQPATVSGRVYLPGARTKGVALAIVLVTVDNKTGKGTMSRAYIHPAWNYKSLFLVDSGLERKTLDLLMQTLHAMGGKFVVEKPLFDDMARFCRHARRAEGHR